MTLASLHQRRATAESCFRLSGSRIHRTFGSEKRRRFRINPNCTTPRLEALFALIATVGHMGSGSAGDASIATGTAGIEAAVQQASITSRLQRAGPRF